MTRSTACDRLEAARPDALASSDRRAMLARILSSPLEAESPVAMDQDPGRQGRRPLHRRPSVLVGVAAAAAAGVAVPLAFGANGSAPGAEIQLASYTFGLPSGFRQSGADTRACDPGFLISYPRGTFQGVKEMFGQISGQPNVPGVVSAANASGGCVSMVLVGPYTPGGRFTPTVSGIGGPMSTGTDHPHPVQIGPYQAQVGEFTLPVWYRANDPTEANAKHQPEVVLDVTLPASGGQVQDLVVTAAQLSEQQLVSMVSDGLAGTQPAAGPTTPAPEAAAPTSSSPATTSSAAPVPASTITPAAGPVPVTQPASPNGPVPVSATKSGAGPAPATQPASPHGASSTTAAAPATTGPAATSPAAPSLS